MNDSFCKGCGAPIVWATSSTGKSIPLDPRAKVYSVVPERGRLIAVEPLSAVIGERFMVSHFTTCPKANQFSGSKKQEQPPAPVQHFSEPVEAE